MPHDPESFAEMMVMTVKSALAPLQERLAASEQKCRDLESRVVELSGFRDRVTVMETKAALAPTVSQPEPLFDATPLLERLAASEAKVSVLGDLRERVALVEAKAAAPLEAPNTEIAQLEARLMATEAQLVRLRDVREQVTQMATKAAVPIVPDTALAERVAAVETRLTAAELRAEVRTGEMAPMQASIAELSKDIGAMRERVAVVEVRGQAPGPAGIDGAPGRDGVNGRDGQDGVGFDDVSVDFDGERTATLKFQKGDRIKSYPIVFPIMRQRGVYIDGKSYMQGDVTTWAGSQWHCDADETTTKPGDGAKGWTLVVKRGRDGKDAKP